MADQLFHIAFKSACHSINTYYGLYSFLDIWFALFKMPLVFNTKQKPLLSL